MAVSAIKELRTHSNYLSQPEPASEMFLNVVSNIQESLGISTVLF